MGKGNFYAKCDKPTSIHSFRKPSWDMNIFFYTKYSSWE